MCGVSMCIIHAGRDREPRDLLYIPYNPRSEAEKHSVTGRLRMLCVLLRYAYTYRQLGLRVVVSSAWQRAATAATSEWSNPPQLELRNM